MLVLIRIRERRRQDEISEQRAGAAGRAGGGHQSGGGAGHATQPPPAGGYGPERVTVRLPAPVWSYAARFASGPGVELGGRALPAEAIVSSTGCGRWWEPVRTTSGQRRRVSPARGDHRPSGARGMTTVIETTGLDPDRRALAAAGSRARMACVAVVSTPRRRSAGPQLGTAAPGPGRCGHRPPAGLAGGPRRDARWGFDRCWPRSRWGRPGSLRLRPAARRPATGAPVGLRFGLHLSAFPGGAPRWARGARDRGGGRRGRLRRDYVMDHFRQIPQVGRAGNEFLESWTTVAWLAACTVGCGWARVSGVTYRTSGTWRKIVATLDVLSGRACGVRPSGWAGSRPSTGLRLAVPRSTSATRCWRTRWPLAVLWVRRENPYGAVLDIPDTSATRGRCRTGAIVLGGGGERRTLRLRPLRRRGQRAGRVPQSPARPRCWPRTAPRRPRGWRGRT